MCGGGSSSNSKAQVGAVPNTGGMAPLFLGGFDNSGGSSQQASAQTSLSPQMTGGFGMSTQPNSMVGTPTTFNPQVSSAGTFTPPQTAQQTAGNQMSGFSAQPTQANQNQPQFGFQSGLPQQNQMSSGNMNFLKQLLGMG